MFDINLLLPGDVTDCPESLIYGRNDAINLNDVDPSPKVAMEYTNLGLRCSKIGVYNVGF